MAVAVAVVMGSAGGALAGIAASSAVACVARSSTGKVCM